MLKNVSFSVKPGETVALVGPTGSGKSSCMSLVHRFYEVWRGRRCWSAAAMCATSPRHSLGENVAMVLQEPFLFSGTVFENIRYHKTSATRDDVIAAAKAVGAHDFIMRLPDGYDTLLEQRGGNLSLGQRQFSASPARWSPMPKILVLDEATANIDSYTEMLIQKALVRLLEGRTGLVIAHRLATIRNADRIVVLAERRDHRERHPRPADGARRSLCPALRHELRLLRRRHGRVDDGAAGRRGDLRCERLVPLTRVERVRPFGQQILSLSRLPVPPQGLPPADIRGGPDGVKSRAT